MTSKIITIGQEARMKMLEGVEILAKAVGATLGPKGRTVVISKSHGTPRITKDGVTVAKEVKLRDKEQDLGAQLIKSATVQSAETAGDGTTTTTILVHSICKEGNQCVVANMKPKDLQAGMEYAAKETVEFIAKNSKAVNADQSEIAQVATISANGNVVIGEKIAEAIKKVGANSPITVEEGKGTELEVDVVEGMAFDRSYISPYFMTNEAKMTAELENPYILIMENKLTSLQPIVGLLEKVAKAGKSLFVIAEDVEGEALAGLLVNKMRGVLKVCAVKAPGFGDRRKAMLEDIAVLTGGTVVVADLGMELENVTLEQLGTAKRIVVSKDSTTIIDGNGDEDAIKARGESILAQSKSTTSDYDREKLEERYGKLCGGVAVLKVGGATEVEMKEKKDRVEDALAATRAAMQEGIVSGGGTILLYAAMHLAKMKPLENRDQQAGVEMIIKALEAPITRILENAGANAPVIIGKIKDKCDANYGYDAQNNEFTDMFKSGIVDPAKVSRIAVQTAVSVASLLLSTEVIITDSEDDKLPSMGAGMGGMGGMY